MEPLANIIRPKSFDEVIGHTKLIRTIKRMLEEKHLMSLILYGPTGVGKTTIALLVAEHFPLSHFKFNASTDTKATLKQIVESSRHYGNILLIIDEIHRMNKDIQDYLLPYVETGAVIMLGLTTENPYISCNPAIRSRATIYRMDRPSQEEILDFLKKIDLSRFEKTVSISDDVYDYLSFAANGELRTAINMLEALMVVSKDGDQVSVETAKDIIGRPSISTDKNGNDYYDILSAFHKSVRGSDVNAALHYLARLIVAEDLESLLRRIASIVYEDIGLANPSMGPKVAAVLDVCRFIGFPEATNALGAITIEMCLSPKSNSAHMAVFDAVADVRDGKTFKVPTHLINNPTYDDKIPYKYAHDLPDHIVAQQYLPDELVGKEYYVPQDHTKLEELFKQQYEFIKSRLNQK